MHKSLYDGTAQILAQSLCENPGSIAVHEPGAEASLEAGSRNLAQAFARTRIEQQMACPALRIGYIV